MADPHLKTDDVRITRTRPLLTPAALEEEIPAPGSALELVSRARGAIRDIMFGDDPRTLVVVGPCSIHDVDAALEYADRLAAAVANGWQPDLERLEQLEHVADMQRVDYEQAWAWVHFLMHGHPRGPEVLRQYLGNLAQRPYAGLLGPRIRESIPDADRLLLAYVRKLPTLGHPMGVTPAVGSSAAVSVP